MTMTYAHWRDRCGTGWEAGIVYKNLCAACGGEASDSCWEQHSGGPVGIQAAGQPIRHSGGFQRQMWPSQWAATSGARVLSFPILVTRVLFLNHKSSVVLYTRWMGQQCSVLKTHLRIHCLKVFFNNKVIQVSGIPFLVFFLTCPSSFCTSE